MDRRKQFQRDCDKFAALRRIFLIILVVVCALFTALADFSEYLRKKGSSSPFSVDSPSCPPSTTRVEQLNSVERVCEHG